VFQVLSDNENGSPIINGLPCPAQS